VLDTVDITGCPLNEDQIEEFWLAIHNNISLSTFKYDNTEENHLEVDAIDQIATELDYNNDIQTIIMPN
jgi:hypothetical protein